MPPVLPYTDLTPQQKLLVDYMAQDRSITVKVAMVALNVNSLTKRIAELRKLGYTIEKEREVGNDGRSFLKYRFPKKA